MQLLHSIENINFKDISEDRKQILQPLIDYIQNKITSNEIINLNFICTHNSRRSHLAQIWAQTMAFHFQISNVFCYSGGTETTAMYPKVGEILVKQGFEMQTLSTSENSVYAIKYDKNAYPIICFSKKYDDKFNPESNFAAIMTCSTADQGCPFIAGAEKRIPITYEDPKIYDDTSLCNEKYMERSLEIAAEMYFVFSQLK